MGCPKLTYHNNTDLQIVNCTKYVRSEKSVLNVCKYNEARYYDSDVARFLSLDPLAAKFVSWNPFNYVLGNPIRLIDPDGKAPTGEYFDFATGKSLGTDGVNDDRKYNINKDAFNSISEQYCNNRGEPLKAALSEYSNVKEEPSPYLQKYQSSVSESTNSNGAKNFKTAAQGGLTVNQITQSVRNKKPSAFASGAGTALTIIEGAEIISNGADAFQQYTTDGSTEKLEKVGGDVAKLVGDRIADKLISSPNPWAKAFGIAWYAGDLLKLGTGGSPAIYNGTREERQLHFDKDNTRVGNVGNSAL